MTHVSTVPAGLPWNVSAVWLSDNTAGSPNGTMTFSGVRWTTTVTVTDENNQQVSVTCSYVASQVTGTFFNPDNSASGNAELHISNQPASASGGEYCTSATVSATYLLTGQGGTKLQIRRDFDPAFECLDGASPCTKVGIEVKNIGGAGWRSLDPGGVDPDPELHDGATLRLTVKVVNNNDATRRSLDEEDIEFYDVLSGRKLVVTGEPQEIAFDEDHEATQVRYEWRTDGYAWENGAKVETRTIEARFTEDARQDDGNDPEPAQRDFPIQPRPIVLVHGWNSDSHTWDGYEAKLKDWHGGWEAFAVGDGSHPGVMDTHPVTGLPMSRNAAALATYVEDVRRDRDAPQVDLVVHSMGGLIARQYIHSLMPMNSDGSPAAKNLFMYGTPHLGSPCADQLAAVILLVSLTGHESTPTVELQTQFAETFNQIYVNRHGVEMAGIAGVLNRPTCFSLEHGDVVVPRSSAHYIGQPTDVPLEHWNLHKQGNSQLTLVVPELNEDPDQVHAPVQTPSTGPAAVAPRAAGDSISQQIAAPASLEVPADGSVDYEIPVGAASGLAVITDAPKQITTDLLDPTGVPVSSIIAGSTEAEAPVRTQRADNPSPGIWKLRMSQLGGAPTTVHAGAAFEGGPLSMGLQGTQVSGVGPVSIIATPTRSGTPALGADLDARVADIDGNQVLVTLADNGTSGDGQAGDGIYGGVATGLPTRAATILGTATLPDGLVTASAAVRQVTPDQPTLDPPALSPQALPAAAPSPAQCKKKKKKKSAAAAKKRRKKKC